MWKSPQLPVTFKYTQLYISLLTDFFPPHVALFRDTASMLVFPSLHLGHNSLLWYKICCNTAHHILSFWKRWEQLSFPVSLHSPTPVLTKYAFLHSFPPTEFNVPLHSNPRLLLPPVPTYSASSSIKPHSFWPWNPNIDFWYNFSDLCTVTSSLYWFHFPQLPVWPSSFNL